MPQCKISGCKEEAVPGGKRYCPFHKARWQERRKRELEKPQCAHCGKQRTNLKDEQGWPRCKTCENRMRKEARQQDRRWQIMNQFDGIDSLQEMKDFLYHYALDDIITKALKEET